MRIESDSGEPMSTACDASDVLTQKTGMSVDEPRHTRLLVGP